MPMAMPMIAGNHIPSPIIFKRHHAALRATRIPISPVLWATRCRNLRKSRQYASSKARTENTPNSSARNRGSAVRPEKRLINGLNRRDRKIIVDRSHGAPNFRFNRLAGFQSPEREQLRNLPGLAAVVDRRRDPVSIPRKAWGVRRFLQHTTIVSQGSLESGLPSLIRCPGPAPFGRRLFGSYLIDDSPAASTSERSESENCLPSSSGSCNAEIPAAYRLRVRCRDNNQRRVMALNGYWPFAQPKRE